MGKYTDRCGLSSAMKTRCLRLTDEEDKIIDLLTAKKECTLRDLIGNLIIAEYNRCFEKEKKNNEKKGE